MDDLNFRLASVFPKYNQIRKSGNYNRKVSRHPSNEYAKIDSVVSDKKVHHGRRKSVVRSQMGEFWKAANKFSSNLGSDKVIPPIS